jgi:hypothetical protein
MPCVIENVLRAFYIIEIHPTFSGSGFQCQLESLDSHSRKNSTVRNAPFYTVSSCLTSDFKSIRLAQHSRDRQRGQRRVLRERVGTRLANFIETSAPQESPRCRMKTTTPEPQQRIQKISGERGAHSKNRGT